MAMSVNFMWRAPQMVAGRSDPNGYSEGLGKVGESIFRFKQSRRAEEERQRNAARQAELDRMNAEERQRNAARQAELDRMNAEDRQRRIQAEDRQQKLYGETANLIRSRKEERARLVKRRNEIVAKIAEIESRLK